MGTSKCKNPAKIYYYNINITNVGNYIWAHYKACLISYMYGTLACTPLKVIAHVVRLCNYAQSNYINNTTIRSPNRSLIINICEYRGHN